MRLQQQSARSAETWETSLFRTIMPFATARQRKQYGVNKPALGYTVQCFVEKRPTTALADKTMLQKLPLQ